MKTNSFKSLAFIAVMASCVCLGCSEKNDTKGAKPEKTEKPAKQSSKTATQSAGLRIACVQLDSIRNQYLLYKEVQDELEKKQADAEAQVTQRGKALAKRMQSLQERAQASQLTQMQYEEEAKQLQQEQASFENFQARLTIQLQEQAAKRQKEMVDTIHVLVKQYAQDKGYDYILCTSSDIDNVLYANPEYDVTDEIVKVLNQAYKKK